MYLPLGKPPWPIHGQCEPRLLPLQGDDAKMELALGPEMARRTTRMYGIKELTRNIGFIFPGLLDAGVSSAYEGALDTEGRQVRQRRAPSA